MDRESRGIFIMHCFTLKMHFCLAFYITGWCLFECYCLVYIHAVKYMAYCVCVTSIEAPTDNTCVPPVFLQGLFEVPPLPDRTIPYTRVNHNKYMVSDKAAYISKPHLTHTQCCVVQCVT